MQALALLLLLPSAPIPEKPKAPPKMIDKLQGVWNITAMERSGAAGAIRSPERYTLVIVGDSYIFMTHGGTMKIDADKKGLDLTVTHGRYKGREAPLLALFELKGDTLQLAMRSVAQPGERPTDLKTGEGTTHVLYTFQRDTKATKEQAVAKLKELQDALPTGPGRGGRGAFGGTAPNSAAANAEMLRQIIEKLDRIEKRLDAIEKKQATPEKK